METFSTNVETYIIKFVTKIGFLYQNESSNCLKSILYKSNIGNYDYFNHMALNKCRNWRNHSWFVYYSLRAEVKSLNWLRTPPDLCNKKTSNWCCITVSNDNDLLQLCSLGRAILCLPWPITRCMCCCK